LCYTKQCAAMHLWEFYPFLSCVLLINCKYICYARCSWDAYEHRGGPGLGLGIRLAAAYLVLGFPVQEVIKYQGYVQRSRLDDTEGRGSRVAGSRGDSVDIRELIHCLSNEQSQNSTCPAGIPILRSPKSIRSSVFPLTPDTCSSVWTVRFGFRFLFLLGHGHDE